MKQIFLAIALIVVPVALFSGYQIYGPSKAEAAASGLGDLSALQTIIADVQGLADKGDLPGAAKRVIDFETGWDQAETAIRPLDPTRWGQIDEAADAALHALRDATPAADKVKATLAALMATLTDTSKAS